LTGRKNGEREKIEERKEMKEERGFHEWGV
jgi:hypothetical protein